MLGRGCHFKLLVVMSSAVAQDLLSSLLAYAKTHGAYEGDAVLFESTDVSVSRRLRKPEGLERSESRALGLRVWVGAQQAIVSSTDLEWESLKNLAERAVSIAKAATADPDATLAPPAFLARQYPALELYDPVEPPESWLMEQACEAEEAALSTPGITNSEGADAQYSAYGVTLVTAPAQGTGFAGAYQGTSFSFSAAVLAGEGTAMERDYDYAHARWRSDLPLAASIGKSAAMRALKRLHPRKVSSCTAPVVFDPRISKSLIGYFASAISGASVARGTSFLKNALHQPLFLPSVSIVDDPHRMRGLASKPFDAEGVQNRKTTLVENGILQSWLLDMRSANRLNLTPTGHASRNSSAPPSPSSSNLYMESGVLSPAELMHDIQSGFYVTETFGMGVNLVTGDYSQGAAGFWIENGEIAYPVSEVTIAGTLQEMFARALPANDLVFRYATNCPTLRIDAMTVAGS